MNLINDFEQNNVLNFNNSDKIIETLLSKVFFFGNTVCKIYKWKKAFYGDLSDINFRKEFISEDFFWNNIMSSDIYIKLLSLKYNSGQWEESSIENADDLCIVMNRLKSEETLTDFADSKKITPDILEKLTKTIINKQRKITEFRKKELSSLLNQNLKDIEKEAIKDLRSWGYMAKEKLPKEKTDYVAEKLLPILDSSEYYDWQKKAQKSACIDGNGDNVIITQSGEILFIDILPPKFNWRVEDEVLNLARAAADTSALTGNTSYADVLYKSYKKLTGLEVPSVVRNLYEIRGAMIQVAYRIILNQPSRAKKYLDFVEQQINNLR